MSAAQSNNIEILNWFYNLGIGIECNSEIIKSILFLDNVDIFLWMIDKKIIIWNYEWLLFIQNKCKKIYNWLKFDNTLAKFNYINKFPY